MACLRKGECCVTVTGLGVEVEVWSAGSAVVISRCWTAGETGGLRKRIGTAVEEESRRSRSPSEDVGRACSERVGEVGADMGRGGSFSSGKASNCHGCRPVRRVSSARLSSIDRCGGVRGRSIPADGVRNGWISSAWVPSAWVIPSGERSWDSSARLPGMILSAGAWASVSSSGSGVAAATALSSKKACSSSCCCGRRCVRVLAGEEAGVLETERSCNHNINIHSIIHA